MDTKLGTACLDAVHVAFGTPFLRLRTIHSVEAFMPDIMRSGEGSATITGSIR
jgi:hypothetical protein